MSLDAHSNIQIWYICGKRNDYCNDLLFIEFDRSQAEVDNIDMVRAL